MKQKTIKFRLFSCLYLTVFLLGNCAFTNQINGADFTVYDLINEVNTIRVSNGLATLQINSTLMNIAQSHSEYQASMHRSSHTGSSGEIINDRVAAAGYGAGGKIVAGENVAGLDVSVTDMLPIVVYEIWSDSGHRGAMINPKYQDVGAGIATDGKTVYITLNLAGIVSENVASAATSVSNLTTPTLQSPNVTGNPAILPLYTSTPLSDGAVYHVVGYGQTLSTIARIYQVDIKELVRINQIEPDKIFVGQKLLIRSGGIVTPAVTIQATIPPNITSTLTLTSIPEIAQTITPTPASDPIKTKETGLILIFVLFGIISVLSLFYFSRLQSRK